MKKIFSAQNSIEAHFSRGKLLSEGIDCCVQGEYLEGVAGGIPVGAETACTVWVQNDEDEPKALNIIKNLS